MRARSRRASPSSCCRVKSTSAAKTATSSWTRDVPSTAADSAAVGGSAFSFFPSPWRASAASAARAAPAARAARRARTNCGAVCFVSSGCDAHSPGVLLEVRQVVVGPRLHQLDRRLGVRRAAVAHHRRLERLLRRVLHLEARRRELGELPRRPCSPLPPPAQRLRRRSRARAQQAGGAVERRHRRPQRGEVVEGEGARLVAVGGRRRRRRRDGPHCEAAAAARSAAPAAPKWPRSSTSGPWRRRPWRCAAPRRAGGGAGASA